MKPLFVAGVLVLAAGCSPTAVTNALNTPSGQLFCAVQADGGGAIVVGLIDAAASAAGAGPVAVIATGAAQSTVNADCALAKGIPVSPPANPATRLPPPRRRLCRAIGFVAYAIAFGLVVWLIVDVILLVLGPDPPG